MSEFGKAESENEKPDVPPEPNSEKLKSLVRTVSEASTEEIDRIISQLEAVRAMLRSEGERVTQQITGYERLSETAMHAANDINDRLKRGRTGS